MSLLRFAKVVAALPATLAPNTLYLVRTGAGFDLYCSDVTGSIAHLINAPAPGAWNLVHQHVTLAQNASVTLTHAHDPDSTRVVTIVNHIEIPAQDVIPVMTGPATAGCTITASPNNSGFEGWRVADASEADSSAWSFPNLSGWLVIALPFVANIASYKIRSRAYANIGPKAWTLSGSNDGVNWTPIDSQDMTSWAASEVKTFTLSAPAAYSQFRFDITQSFNPATTHKIGITNIELLPQPQIVRRLANPADYTVEYLPSATVITRAATGSMSADITVRI